MKGKNLLSGIVMGLMLVFAAYAIFFREAEDSPAETVTEFPEEMARQQFFADVTPSKKQVLLCPVSFDYSVGFLLSKVDSTTLSFGNFPEKLVTDKYGYVDTYLCPIKYDGWWHYNEPPTAEQAARLVPSCVQGYTIFRVDNFKPTGKQCEFFRWDELPYDISYVMNGKATVAPPPVQQPVN